MAGHNKGLGDGAAKGSFRGSGEAKESKQQGTKKSRQKQKDIGKRALKNLRDKRLAGKGVSDVSKYDDKTARAIQAVDFRNSPIGRSLLADQFEQGLITSSDFQKLQDIQQNPGDRPLSQQRQINQLLGLNPTSGMGILDSLKSGFQGEQFQQDKKRLGQLASLSPVRQAISSLFNLKSDADPTTAQMLGISPEEDARLRLFSNPDLQNIQFDNLLDDFDDTAPEQIVTAPITEVEQTPLQTDASGLAGPIIGGGILATALGAKALTGPPRDVRFKPTVRGLPGVVGSGSAYGTVAKEVAKSPGIFSRFISPLAKPLAVLGSLPVSAAAFSLTPTELAAGDFPIDPITGMPDYSGTDIFNQ